MAVTLVQSDYGGGSGGDTPRLPVAPTAGNLVVLHIDSEDDVPTGFTDALGAFVDVSLGGSGFRVWYRVTQPGDPAILTGALGTGLWIMSEWSGITGATPVAVASSAREGPGSHPHQPINPAGTDEVLVIADFIHVNTLLANFDPDAGWTMVEHYQYPSNVTVAGMVYKTDLIGLGSYDPGVSTAPFSGLWAAGAIAWAGSSVPPPDPPDPPDPDYEAPFPGRAILEIYVSDPTGPRWDEALWDTAEWGEAGWTSITPWSIFADVSWGATRAEAGILHDQEAGVWVVETHDPDRVLDPGNPDSQFYPEIAPGLPIRLLHHSRIIRQGEVTRAWYSHADRGGRINATDAISKLVNARVPEDTILSDNLRVRAIEAIEASAVDIYAWPPVIGGDPELSPAPSGDFSAWDVIEEAAREVLFIPLINNGNRLFFRHWDAPLLRGRVIGSPNIVDVANWISDEGLYSIVRAQEPGGALEERAATPTPRYGKRVYERTRDTINAEAWATRVLADRRDASLRYVPGDLYPLTDADVAWMARLEVMEDVVLSVPQSDPPVLVTARILGMNVRAVDETVQKDPLVIRTRWRWRLITAVVSTSPLTEDGGGEFLYADQDPTEPLYPDGA